MSHDYRIILENEDISIGEVKTTERTETEYTFFDAAGNIVAMFKRDRVQGIIRVMPEPAAKTDNRDTEPAPEPKPKSRTEPPPRVKPAPEKNQEPTGSETEKTPDKFETQRPVIQMRKNRETNGFEVHVLTEPAKPKVQRLIAAEPTSLTESLVLARKEVAATLAETDDEPQYRMVEMKYKDIEATGIYDTVTKKIVIEKGTLIAKKETNSLRKAKNQNGVRAKRRAVLRKSSEPYDPQYHKLTEDVEFNSLSQACCAISGTVLNPKQYWKEIK